MGNIPPRTMRDVWRGENSSLKNLSRSVHGFPVGKIGFDYGSVGSIKRRGTHDTFDVSKHFLNKPRKPRIANIQYEPKIECISDIIEDYNSNGDLGVILEFRGLNFLKRVFTKSRDGYGQNISSYYTRVSFKNKEAFLFLSAIEDILESEVVPQKKGINRLFSDEIYIPQLIGVYDPSSMEVVQKNRLIIVSYKKNDKNY